MGVFCRLNEPVDMKVSSCISQFLLRNNQPKSQCHRTISIYFIHLSVGHLRLSEQGWAGLSSSALGGGFG